MTRVNHLNESVFTVSEFMTAQQCESYIRLTEDIGYSAAPITTSRGPIHRPDIRNNTRVMLDDIDRATDLWQRAQTYVEDWDQHWKPVGLNERLRFYRYDPGQQFNWHFDGAYERPNGERSWLTFMIYLNDGFVGGSTVFEDVSVVPEAGMALFFVHHQRHMGQAVSEGRKYVLRSDVMYRYCDG